MKQLELQLDITTARRPILGNLYDWAYLSMMRCWVLTIVGDLLDWRPATADELKMIRREDRYERRRK